MRISIQLLRVCLLALFMVNASAAGVFERDLYVKEAFYYFAQGRTVDAIVRLDIALGRTGGRGDYPPYFQVGERGMKVGEFEQSYRMPQRAVQRLVEMINDRYAEEAARNEAAYYLAYLFMQQNEPGNALKAIRIINGKVPEPIREDEMFLRARIYMTNHEYAGAVRLLQKLQDSKNHKVFASYNLGIALIQVGQEKQGIQQLEKTGKVSGDDEVIAALRDRVNMSLGSRMIENKEPERAKQYFSRVRLDGPFSNKAMLGAGMADAAKGRFEEALVPWTVLAGRGMSNDAVQESMLGVPYAYARLNLPGKAATLYGKALEEYDKELRSLDTAVTAVREGKFLQALLGSKVGWDADWGERFRRALDVPGAAYLIDAMTHRDFEVALGNHRDIVALLEQLDMLESRMAASFSAADRRHPDDDANIKMISKRIQSSKRQAASLLARGTQILEKMAIAELERRRKQIQEYRAQASIGLIESYERASKAQASQGGGK